MALTPHHSSHQLQEPPAARFESVLSCHADPPRSRPKPTDGAKLQGRASGGVRMLLVNPCTLCRAGLTLLLQQFDPHLEVIPAHDDSHAMQWLRAWGPCDLTMLAVTLPAGPALHGLQKMRQHWPAMPILALVADEPDGSAAAALSLGATACVARGSTPEQLKRVVFRLLAHAAETVDRKPALQSPFNAQPQHFAAFDDAMPARAACQALHITPCQAAVLRLLCQGLSTKLICRELGLSESTVKTHTHAVFRALSVSSRVQAVIATSAWDWSG